jgi:hypothetical protein
MINLKTNKKRPIFKKLLIFSIPLFFFACGLWNKISDTIGGYINSDNKNRTSDQGQMGQKQENPNSQLFISCGGFLE